VALLVVIVALSVIIGLVFGNTDCPGEQYWNKELGQCAICIFEWQVAVGGVCQERCKGSLVWDLGT